MSTPAAAIPAQPVLIVDDDGPTRALYTRTLEREGLSCLEAWNGDEALSLLRTEQVSLVLLDGKMPGMSGVQVIEKLRNNARTAMLPVVMVTAAADLDARVAGLEAGADDYLAKPIDLEELVARVHTQLRRRSAWNATTVVAQNRAALVEALARVHRDASAEVTAAGACEVLREALPDAAIVAFRVEGASILASSGELAAVLPRGTQLDGQSAARLRDLCERGAWTGADDGRSLIGPFARAACGVPLAVDGRLLGSLLSGSSARPTLRGEFDLLSTAIAVGPVISLLLAPALHQWDTHRRRESDFRQLLEENCLRTHFQPVIDLASGDAVGYEALTRWPDGAPPDARLAAAREVGQGDELERAMVVNALAEAHRLPAGCWISLNMSPVVVLHDSGLPALVAQCPCPVVVELTEQEPVTDYDELRRVLAAFGDDVALAVDDAGAGYASLRHILALEPGYVKLDRDWIHEIERDPARQALVAGLQLFATKTGCSLVAEGIETAEECATVTDLGIRFGQGYFLGRPQALSAANR